MSAFYPCEARKLASVRAHDVANTLTAGANGGDTEPCTVQGGLPRRITPGEREAMMGFTAGHTDVPGASDAARNRALGNSIAINCLQFIGQRISEIE